MAWASGPLQTWHLPVMTGRMTWTATNTAELAVLTLLPLVQLGMLRMELMSGLVTGLGQHCMATMPQKHIRQQPP